MRLHHTMIQLYTIMKDFQPGQVEAYKHKQIIFVFICKFWCYIIAILMWKLLL